MSVREKDDPDLYARIQERNLLRQYDLLTNCIEIGEDPIYVGNHCPPHFKEVPNLMDRFFSLVHENWELADHPTLLAAHALWRLNWIHPFVEGNGRTARAACYYLLCLRHGQLLPGCKIVPERIRENRRPYYAALQAADVAWEQGHFGIDPLAEYLGALLKQQLTEA